MLRSNCETVTSNETASRHSVGYRRYVLWLLLIIYFLNFLDRQVLNILAEPIKRELGLSDSQLGLLTGLSFALFYTVLGLPIARLAERSNRVRIIGVSLAIWSAFTAACGLAQNYAQLLLMRVGVGVGEAGCSPPAHSLISDYFPREERASALGFYAMGIPLGTMAGLAFGGIIADAYGWRTAMFVAGAPGLVVAVLALLTLKETRATLSQAQKKVAALAPTIGEAARELLSKRAFLWGCAGASVTALASYGHTAFYASFYLRNHATGVSELATGLSQLTGGHIQSGGFLGLALGLIIGVGGVAGTLIGGRLSDRWGKNDARVHVTLPAIAILVSVPFVIAALLTGNTLLSLLLVGPLIFLKSFWFGPIFAIAQSVVRPHTRATAAAVLLFLMNLVGLGLGPLLVGVLSDGLSARMGDGEGLRWAMVSSTGLLIVAPLCFLMARGTIRRDIVEDGPAPNP